MQADGGGRARGHKYMLPAARLLALRVRITLGRGGVGMDVCIMWPFCVIR
jgi:hypothetical protein